MNPYISRGLRATIERLRDYCGPAVRDHIARVMAAGVKCRRCHGSGEIPDPHQARPPRCPDCSGTGYLLRPAPIEHLLDRPGSCLTADCSAALVAWSARSWLRGGPVLVDIAGEWCVEDDGRVRRRGLLVRFRFGAVVHTEADDGIGWVVFNSDVRAGPLNIGPLVLASGPETGAEGRACADRALLAAHIAYIDNGSVVLPEEPDHV